MTREQIIGIIERKKKAFDALITTHGHGCRPSWVSGELAAIGSSITSLESMLTEEAAQ